MLVAEAHGKVCEAAQGHEDSLTSAVFGHLRYVRPGRFWEKFLGAAKGMPGSDGIAITLGQALKDAGVAVEASLTKENVRKYPIGYILGDEGRNTQPVDGGRKTHPKRRRRSS